MKKKKPKVITIGKVSTGPDRTKAVIRDALDWARRQHALNSGSCYAPSRWCVTHDCYLDTCWKAGRCSAAYALART